MFPWELYFLNYLKLGCTALKNHLKKYTADGHPSEMLGDGVHMAWDAGLQDLTSFSKI